MPDLNRTQFINLIKQYWKSHPDLKFEDLMTIFIETDENNITTFISEEKAKEKLLKLCQENDDIDNFFS